MECVARTSPQLRCPLCFGEAPTFGRHCDACGSRAHWSCVHELGACHPDPGPFAAEAAQPGAHRHTHHRDETLLLTPGWVSLQQLATWFTGTAAAVGGLTILGSEAAAIPAFVFCMTLAFFATRFTLHGVATGVVESMHLAAEPFDSARQPIAYALSLLFFMASAVFFHVAGLYFVLRAIGYEI